MRAVADAVRRADPAGAAEVLLYTGKDAHGLDVYLAPRVIRVDTPEVESDRTELRLGVAARAREGTGRRWLLVTEADDPNCARGVRRVLGASVGVVERVPGWQVLEVVPR